MPPYNDNHQAEKKRYLRNQKIEEYSLANVEIGMTHLLCVYMCICEGVKFAYYCVWSYWRLLMCVCVMIRAYSGRIEVVSWIKP